jgi:hypothetical protein
MPKPPSKSAGNIGPWQHPVAAGLAMLRRQRIVARATTVFLILESSGKLQ